MFRIGHAPVSVVCGGLILYAALTITLIVVGILGATGIVSMPSSLYCNFIGMGVMSMISMPVVLVRETGICPCFC